MIKFPEKSLEELLRLAFKGRVIDYEAHPVVKQALGLKSPSPSKSNSPAARNGRLGWFLELPMTIPFREVWCVDFDFQSDPGEQPWPICMVAREFHSGREIWMWRGESLARRRAPFDVGPEAVLVAYYAIARRARLFPGTRLATAGERDRLVCRAPRRNGKALPCGNGLLGALAIRGLAHIDAGKKRSDASSREEHGSRRVHRSRKLLDYCARNSCSPDSLALSDGVR